MQLNDSSDLDDEEGESNSSNKESEVLLNPESPAISRASLEAARHHK